MMRSSSKYVLVAALLFCAAAEAHEDAAGSATTLATEAEPDDRIARTAAKFRGSIFLFDQSITPDTIDKQAQQSSVPSYQWWFSLRPRYYIKPNISLRLRMDLTVEWTNGGADTTLLREPQFGDLWTDVAYNPKTFLGIASTLTFRAVWGTSKTSMAATQVVKLGPSVGLVRDFHTNKAGDFELSAGVYGLYHATTNPGNRTATSYGCASTDFTPTSCTTGGIPPTIGSLTALVGGKWSPTPKVSLSLSYVWIDSWATSLQHIAGQPDVGPQFLQSGWFLADIDYDPRDWVEFSVGYYCFRPINNPDAKFGDPFWSPGGNSRIYFTTTFNLDRVYDAAARRSQRSSGHSLASSGSPSAGAAMMMPSGVSF